jgi:hypothetical protein
MELDFGPAKVSIKIGIKLCSRNSNLFQFFMETFGNGAQNKNRDPPSDYRECVAYGTLGST